MRKILTVIGLLVSGVAWASPWSVHLMIGDGDALGAATHGQAQLTQVRAACGCAVSGSIATSEVAARFGVRRAFGPRLAIAGSIFNLGSFDSTGTAGAYNLAVTDRVYGGTVEGVVRGHVRRLLWHVGAGVAVTHDSETSAITGAGISSSASAATTKASAAVSGGLGYRIDARWSIGASVLYVPQVGSAETATSGQYTNGGLLLAGVAGAYRF